MPRSRIVKFAAASVTGLAVVAGGLAAAGALPDVASLSSGHSSVDSVPPPAASPTGVEHANSGGAAADNAAVTGDAPTTLDAPENPGSNGRAQGLQTASGNVTNDTASAVINTLINTEPGPGLGAAVAAVASDSHANVPSDVPPVSLPDQASNGQSHRP
jgi:hypothetical protein